MIALLILVFAIIALLQVPSLVRKQWWRELITFLVLWLLGLILSILVSLGVKIQVTSIIWNILTKISGLK
ncbi:MAG: hypothetical protein ABFC94_11050 [Syntrophomonas sp.]